MPVPVPFGKRAASNIMACALLPHPPGSERASAVCSAALRSRALATESH
eukprot:CAMPEP_0202784986 /NCGR_PEP_ID=MMETSP1388-20130828/67479_1 /ASSEMBLY_ACC=CAM_ASM_000864 /TAXON_ID=37098 /ORGANISM="Isochrysis sp, Strain CCMP1244" /LENGTH=48 /DNA_ID= /DNA_START= /DNA_END= /DNA_ORIENTATION=